MSSSTTIDVSVIIPVFNAEFTLQRAIYSTLKQGVNHEIIIINDCSSDDSLTIAENLQKIFTNIKIINLQNNSGASTARNRGIKIARGKYIAFLDADDVWLPGKLIAQMQMMESNEDCSIVSCDTLQIAPSGEVLRRGHAHKPPVSGKEAWKTLLSYNFIPTPTVLTRTSLVKQVGGFDENLTISEDLDLWIHLARKGEVIILPDVFVHYFDYSQSLMKRGVGKSFSKTLEMINKHINDEKKLSQWETDKIMSHRYLQIGFDALSSNKNEDADYYFKQAIRCGYPSWEIKKRLLKKYIKSIFI